MKKPVKILSAVLALTMFALCFAGCGKDEKKETVFIGSADDLKGKIISVQEGTTGDTYVTEAENKVEAANIVRFKKVTDAAQEVKNGKADAMVVDSEVAKRVVQQNDDLMVLDTPLTQEVYAIAVRKGDTQLLEAINKTIARIKADGTYDKIMAAYIPETGTDPVPMPAREKTNFAESIKMGTNAEFEPFEYQDNGKITGFDVEMAYEIANDMQKNLVIENMNFDSLLIALNGGKLDMVIAALTANDERKKEVDFSDTYYEAAQMIVIRKTSAIENKPAQ